MCVCVGVCGSCSSMTHQESHLLILTYSGDRAAENEENLSAQSLISVLA